MSHEQNNGGPCELCKGPTELGFLKWYCVQDCDKPVTITTSIHVSDTALNFMTLGLAANFMACNPGLKVKCVKHPVYPDSEGTIAWVDDTQSDTYLRFLWSPSTSIGGSISSERIKSNPSVDDVLKVMLREGWDQSQWTVDS